MAAGASREDSTMHDGLVYGVHLDDDTNAVIDMTLTTPACPLGPPPSAAFARDWPWAADLLRRLSELRGKGVLVNVWATWCGPCKIEMPWFVELQKEYGPQGLQIVGVAMDDASKDEIQKFAKEMGVTLAEYQELLGKVRMREQAARYSIHDNLLDDIRRDHWFETTLDEASSPPPLAACAALAVGKFVEAV